MPSPMMVRELDVGEELKSTITFKVKNDTTGLWVETDPTTVVFKSKSPSDVVTTKTYGIAAEITKVATGVYRCSFVLTAVGDWWYRWTATGTVNTARERRVRARPTEF